MSSLCNFRANALPLGGGAGACGFAQKTATIVTDMNAGLMGVNPGSRNPGGGGTS